MGQFCGRAKIHVLGTRRAHREHHGMLPRLPAVGNRLDMLFVRKGMPWQAMPRQCHGKPRPRHAMAWAAKAMPLTSFRDLTDIYHKVDLKSIVM